MQFLDEVKEISLDEAQAYEKSTMTIEKVLDQASTYLHKEKNLKMIMDAYLVASKQHEGQLRKSGELYIQHPLEVAYMLTTLGCGPATICAGLLHDVVEDTNYPIEKIKEQFGSDVAIIVDGVTKISKLKYMTKEKALAKTHQKILIAMAKDIRVVLVKLVDRLHNMRTLQFQPVDKQVRIAKETLDLYAPLAHRLGMYRIKAELEDLSFRYIEAKKYGEISRLVKEHKMLKEDGLNLMEKRIEEILTSNHISKFEIKGRVKNIFSVSKKMEEKNKTFDQIYDLLALRILVPTIEDCYRVLGLMHAEWTPLPMRFKDYIATPKPNMYQSLHTTVVGIGGSIFEIQIRTYEMDEVAEIGIAAHWSYKEENKSYSPEKEQQELSEKLRWYRELLTYAEMNEDGDVDPLQDIKKELFNANIYVFTPKGDVIDMPNGGNPLDFAYRIHTEVGNHTVGAIVNDKIVPLTYKLKTGDVVEIKTNKNFNGPTEAWLKICSTSHARHKITAILNKRKRDEYVSRGEAKFDELLKANNNDTKITDKLVKDNFARYNIDNLEEFYYEIGKGTLSDKGAYNKMFNVEEVGDEALIRQYNDDERRHKSSTNAFGILVDGIDKAQIKIACCCHPVPGDPIVGFVSKGNGIIVHRFECPNVRNSDQNRFIDVYWDKDAELSKTFESVITILSYNRKNILSEIINVLNATTVSISNISSTKTRQGELLTRIKFFVKDSDVIENAIVNIKKISDVYTVERVMK